MSMSNRDDSLQTPQTTNESEDVMASQLRAVLARAKALREAVMARSGQFSGTTTTFKEAEDKIERIKALQEEKRKREEEAKEVGLHEKLPAILAAKKRRVQQLNERLVEVEEALNVVSKPLEPESSEEEQAPNDDAESVFSAFSAKVNDLKRHKRKNSTVQVCSERHMRFFEDKLNRISAEDENLKAQNEEATHLLNEVTSLLNKNRTSHLSN